MSYLAILFNILLIVSKYICGEFINKVEKKINEKELKFNTYCIFTEEKEDIEETIGLVFRDYLESLIVK